MVKPDPETLGARLVHENGSLKRTTAKQYEKIRKLENTIRKHALAECDCKGPHECMVRLHDLVPAQPRPTLRQARALAYAKTRRI